MPEKKRETKILNVVQHDIRREMLISLVNEHDCGEIFSAEREESEVGGAEK